MLMDIKDKQLFILVLEGIIKEIANQEFEKAVTDEFSASGFDQNDIRRIGEYFRTKLTNVKNNVAAKKFAGDAQILVKGTGMKGITGSSAANLQKQIDRIETQLNRLLQKDKIDKQQKSDNESVIRIIKPKDAIIGLSHTAANSFDESVTLFFDMMKTQLQESSVNEISKLMKDSLATVSIIEDKIKGADDGIFKDLKGEPLRLDLDTEPTEGVVLDADGIKQKTLEGAFYKLNALFDTIFSAIETIKSNKALLISKIGLLDNLSKNDVKSGGSLKGGTLVIPKKN